MEEGRKYIVERKGKMLLTLEEAKLVALEIHSKEGEEQFIFEQIGYTAIIPSVIFDSIKLPEFSQLGIKSVCGTEVKVEEWDRMSIGSRIKWLREKQGLTAEKMAGLLGLSGQATDFISSIKSMEERIFSFHTIDVLQGVARVLGCEIGDLVDYREQAD